MAVEAAPASVCDAIAADPHRPGSVDRALLDAQVFVSPANHGDLYAPPTPVERSGRVGRTWLREIAEGLTRDAAHAFERATALRRWVASVPRAFPEGGRSTRDGFWGDFSTFLCGGTEEEVVRKGTPLAAELCRVLVLLAHLSGQSARVVFLYADAPPVRHTVVEIWVNGRWVVFDPVSDRSFAWPKHGYVGAWDIHQQPRLLDGLQDHARLPYVAGRFYRTVAIAPYGPCDQSLRFPWDPLDAAARARLMAGDAS
jgi:hypothetical protein